MSISHRDILNSIRLAFPQPVSAQKRTAHPRSARDDATTTRVSGRKGSVLDPDEASKLLSSFL